MRQSIVYIVWSFVASIALCACGEVQSTNIDGGDTVDASDVTPDGNVVPDANDNPTICSWDESNWDECNWAP